MIGLDALWGRAGSTLRARLLEQPTPALTLRLMEQALLEQVVRPLAYEPRSATEPNHVAVAGVDSPVIGGDSRRALTAITSNGAIPAR